MIGDLDAVTLTDCAGYGCLAECRPMLEGSGRTLTVRGRTGQPARLLAMIAAMGHANDVVGTFLWSPSSRSIPDKSRDPIAIGMRTTEWWVRTTELAQRVTDVTVQPVPTRSPNGSNEQAANNIGETE